jgi:hypothetical protein
MSITLELPADLEARLAPLTEEEQRRFAVVAIRRELEDPATLACSSGVDKGPLTPDEGAALLEAMNAPAEGPNEAMREVIRNWKKLTGRVAPSNKAA